jgi:hypothetical protein
MPRKAQRITQYPKYPRPRLRQGQQRMPPVMKQATGVIATGSTLILGAGVLGLAAGVTHSLLPP